MADQKRTADFDWQDIRYFLALSREGSLSAAARALRASHATISRRIAMLENSVGRALFDRRSNGYSLTAHGSSMLQRALDMEASAAAVIESLDNDRTDGVVRVSMVRSLAHHFLIDRLKKFARENPSITLEILTDARVVSLARREADIALRLGRPKDSHLVGRRVADLHYAYYASPTVAAAAAASQSVSVVAYDEESIGIPEAEWLRKKLTDVSVAFRSNSVEAQAAAARAGFGIALLPRYLGEHDPALRPVVGFAAPPPRELWLLTTRELSRVPRLRKVISAIKAIVTTEKDLL